MDAMQKENEIPVVSDKANYALLIFERMEKYGDKIALRAKRNGEWYELTWRQFGEKIRQAAKSLMEMGLQEGQMVAIFSPNMPECTIIDVAALSIRCVPVYIYPTNTVSQAQYIVNDCEAQVVFVGGQEQYDKVSTFFMTSVSLKKIIAFDASIVMDQSDDAIYLDDFLDIGKKSTREAQIQERRSRASKEDLLTLIYTSGTTGEPKGRRPMICACSTRTNPMFLFVFCRCPMCLSGPGPITPFTKGWKSIISMTPHRSSNLSRKSSLR
jgi:long-chain acyl-CoA synthetase